MLLALILLTPAPLSRESTGATWAFPFSAAAPGLPLHQFSLLLIHKPDGAHARRQTSLMLNKPGQVMSGSPICQQSLLAVSHVGTNCRHWYCNAAWSQSRRGSNRAATGAAS